MLHRQRPGACMNFPTVVALAMGITFAGVAGTMHVKRNGVSFDPGRALVDHSRECEQAYRAPMNHVAGGVPKQTCQCFDAAVDPLSRGERAAILKTTEELATVRLMGGRGTKLTLSEGGMSFGTDVKVGLAAKRVFRQCGISHY